jgi:hypothetical protein
MKPSQLLVLGAILLAPAVAAAQPGARAPAPGGYYSQPTTVAGGFHDRAGRMSLGFSVGLGGMKANDDAIGCAGCDYDPIAGEFDFHIGGMLSPRFALLFEVQANAQTVAENAYYVDTLGSGAAMIAGQYWLTPQLWIKGGLGFASLSVSRDDGYDIADSESEEGVAVMGGIGFEVYSARNFAVDLQGRLISSSYDGIGQNISAGSVGVGFNWY